MSIHRALKVATAALIAVAAVVVCPPPQIRAASAPTTSVIYDFDGSGDWRVSTGAASIAVQSATKTSGSGALKVDYNLSPSGAVGLVPSGTSAELPGIPRRLSLDVFEDASWNTIYYEIHDATGEILRYWLGNLSASGWRTLTLDFDSATPVSAVAGNGDHVLDLPVSFSQFLIYRNGSQPATGTVYLDRMTYTYDPVGLAIGSQIVVPAAGQSSNVSLSLTDQASFQLRLIGEDGSARSYTGSAGGGSTWSTTWNGTNDSGARLGGSVRASLAMTRNGQTETVQYPYFAGLPARTAGANMEQRGINSFMSEINTSARSAAASEAAQMEAAYVGMAREEFEWVRVEPSKGVYDWAKFDQAVELARAHGMAVLGKLAYGSPWDNTAPAGTPSAQAIYYPPANIQSYVDYAVATVSRYKDRVHAWEIWNEENNAGAWEPAPDPARYTQLLKATYAAIKSVDPGATVVLGGLSTGPDAAFLQGIYANGGWSSFDVLAIHSFVNYSPETATFPLWISDAKARLAQYGQKPIWITEFGWSSFTGTSGQVVGTTLDEQKLYLEQAYEVASGQGVQGIFWFELMNRGTNTASLSDNYGVLYSDRSPKPAFSGLQCEDIALYNGVTPSCSSPVYPASTYHALTPARIFDTRYGIGGWSKRLTNHSPVGFAVWGHGGVPSGAIAVTGNLTVTNQDSNGYLYIGPTALSYPTSSTLNFPKGDDRANAVTVALGSDGSLWVTFVAPSTGPQTNVIFDVTGYFTGDSTGATYHAVTPGRVLDSRDGTGGIGSPLANHLAVSFPVTGHGGVPSEATAVTGNLTVTGQTSGGYFFIGPSETPNPTSSTLNFPQGDDRANAVTVALSPTGSLWLTFVAPRDGPTAHAIFDVTGYFTADLSGARYHPLSPARVLDSRDGTGGVSSPLGNHSPVGFTAWGRGGIASGAVAVTGNLTVTAQSANGFLFIGPTRTVSPTSSTLNFPKGDDRANAATVAVGSDGTLWVTFVGPSDGTSAHAIFDVSGYFAP